MTESLKPSLATAFPRKPRPQAVRPVQCPQCNHRFAISRRAISLRCPKCTEPMHFEDYHFASDVHRDLTTLGEVSIESECELMGKLVCGRLINEGRFKGKARVYGAIQLLSHSTTRGEIVGHSLKVIFGAQLQAKALIGPRFGTSGSVKPPHNLFARARSRMI